jgi:hypothetical protein
VAEVASEHAAATSAMNEENQGKYFRAERCVICQHPGDSRVTLLLGFLHWPDACTQTFASRNEVAANTSDARK